VVIHDLKTVRTMIRMYKQEKCLRTVARKMTLPYKDVVQLVDWIWAQQEQWRRNPEAGLGVGELSAEQYLRYLYTHNASSEAAAAAVDWPEERVWRAVGGKFQWCKRTKRKPLSVRQPEPELMLTDPTPEEIAAALPKLRESWPAARLAEQEGPEGRYKIPCNVETGMVNFN
jgi:hypothetical protein